MSELQRATGLPRPGGSRLSPLLLVCAAAMLAGVPQWLDSQSAWNTAFLICLYITLGQSWNILAGFAGQTSLGHAVFFGIGALVTRALWLSGTAFPLAFLAGGASAMAFGLLIGAPTFRLRGAYFAIGTLGVAESLRIFVSQKYPLISTLSGPMIAAYDLPARYYLALGLAILATGAAYALLRSRWSLGMRALRDDEESAQATGVNAFWHKLLALGLSSLFAGLAGGAFAYQQISYYPAAPFGAIWTFDALLITFLGGLGTLVGPVIGAIFFVLVRQQLSANLAEIHQMVFGVLFILIVLAFPGGLESAWQLLRRSAPRPGA